MKYIHSITLLIVAICFALASCDDNDGPTPPTSGIEIFKFSSEDPTLSPKQQDLTLNITLVDPKFDTPEDWHFAKISTKDENNTFNGDALWIQKVEDDHKSNTIDLDWIRIEKIETGKISDIKITVKQNDGEKPRYARILISKKIADYTIGNGNIEITQHGKYDQNPFTIKAKYKGRIYTSEAALDEDGKINYKNSEFADLMNLLAKKKNVETVIKDDEMIHFFDETDTEAVKSIKMLSQSISPSTTVSAIPLLQSRAVGQWIGHDPASIGYCVMFDDDNFTDTYIFKNLYSLHDAYDEK